MEKMDNKDFPNHEVSTSAMEIAEYKIFCKNLIIIYSLCLTKKMN